MSNQIEREATDYAHKLTKDRSVFDGNDERIALVAYRAGWTAALAKDENVARLIRALEMFRPLACDDAGGDYANLLHARDIAAEALAEFKKAKVP